MNGPSFISYVSEAEKDKEVSQKIAEAMTSKYQAPDKELDSRLLPGEIAIGRTNQVLRYNVHDDPSRGISGTLVCTNFRLTFITVEKVAYDLIDLQNRLLNDHDILLNNIESIYVEYSNKRKKLVPSSKVKDGIQRLELHCKDFRVAAFNFKFTHKGDEKGVITALLHHAYPPKVSRLFAFDYKHDKDIGRACKVPLYRSTSDWDNELIRCGAKKFWRVSPLNKSFTTFTTMGPYLVVPSSVTDNELTDSGKLFTGNRVPIWCWTDSNGCSLSRAPALRPEVEQQYVEDKLHEAIRNSDPKQRPLKVINVSKSCPSCLQLQQSFQKLKSVCMPATQSDFLESDTHWHATLNSTKWMQYISAVLSTSREAAEFIRRKEHNVIIQENVGIDLTSVVTSLVQLILNPSSRRLKGLQALIQKEWVIAGHPFLDRLGHLIQPKKRKQVIPTATDGEVTQQAPVFLLFLDCVYQLMVQFPARFEASHTFLTVLYDATRMAAFDTFIFNNERQRHRSLCEKEWHDQPFALNEVGRAPTIQFLPLWAWEVQFNKSDMNLFNNPLYKMRTMENYKEYVEESAMIVGDRKRIFTRPVLSSDEDFMDDINGDVPDGTVTSFAKSTFYPEAGDTKHHKNPFRKKKPSLKELKMEEHRRKIEKDSPHPLNKTKKSGSIEEYKKNLRSGLVGERSEIIKENKGPKKEPYRATPGGHFPKVALMPKQISVAKLPPSDVKDSGHQRLSRSKSDGERYMDDDEILEDDVILPLNNDENSAVKYLDAETEPESTKLKTRFSLRRKKTKDSLENSDDMHHVPTYNEKLQGRSLGKRKKFEKKGSIHALYPSSSIPELKLWRQCYFRWLPWSQIYGGGPASVLQQESLLYDEIHVLHSKLQMLNRQLHPDSSNYHSVMGNEEPSPLSGMYFSNSIEDLSVFESNSHTSSSQSSLNILPSYFPYSPIKGLRSKSVIGTPISNFLQGGSFFNFGRSRGKHARSQSGISITHHLAQSIEDLASMSMTDDSTSATTSPASKSLEDLTSDTSDIRDRTHSDVPGSRARLTLLDHGAQRPRKLTPSPTSATPPENVTYITSL